MGHRPWIPKICFLRGCGPVPQNPTKLLESGAARHICNRYELPIELPKALERRLAIKTRDPEGSVRTTINSGQQKQDSLRVVGSPSNTRPNTIEYEPETWVGLWAKVARGRTLPYEAPRPKVAVPQNPLDSDRITTLYPNTLLKCILRCLFKLQKISSRTWRGSGAFPIF